MSKANDSLKIQIRLESIDPRRTTARLIEQISADKDDLLRFLKEDEPPEKPTDVAIQPERAISGVEIILVAFLIGFAKGAAEGAGKELGKPVGEKIVRWIKSKFSDVNAEVEPPTPPK